MAVLICNFCKKKFKTYYLNRKYCSLECYAEARKKKWKNCKTCDKRFWSRNLRVYCSSECNELDRENRRKGSYFKCLECGKRVYRYPHQIGKFNTYCSMKCYSVAKKRDFIPFFKGKKHTEKSKQKMREKQLGKKHTEKSRKKMSITQLKRYKKKSEIEKSRIVQRKNPKRGKDSSLWRNGNSTLEDRIRHSWKYLEWRRNVKERDGNSCVGCGNDKRLHAHHIKDFGEMLLANDIKSIEEAYKCEVLWDIDNGMTVCFSCHKKIHEELAPWYLKFKKSPT